MVEQYFERSRAKAGTYAQHSAPRHGVGAQTWRHQCIQHGFAIGLARYLKGKGRVFCAVLEASREDSEQAEAAGVALVRLNKGHQSTRYDEHWAHAVREGLPQGTFIDWWVGHDVISAFAALKGAQVAGGRSAVIMHMNYADYASYKDGSGSEAVRKEKDQRTLFRQAHKHFAVGPLLRDAMRDIVGAEVTMLVPGFAQVHARPAAQRLTLITFGRMDRESDRIKQGALAIAGFASAVRSAQQPGMPRLLRENPQIRVIGISEEKGPEEAALRSFAHEKAGREINLIAQPFDEDRDALFDQLGRANIAMMLSWHEGFGLTGWEAIAAEVPLILSKQSGLRHLVDEALGDPGTACFRSIDVQGQEGDDETSNFTQHDEDRTRDAILDIANDLSRAQANAQRLKRLLQQQLVCTWENTARQFCEGLGPALEAAPALAPTNGAPPRGETSKQIAKANDSGARANESPPPLIGFPERPWPQSLAIEMPDSIMLLPQSEVVPFHSYRRALLDEVLGWALANDQPIKLRLQAGEGGTGKTRLAIAACHQLEERDGWQVGFLRSPDLIEREFPKLLREGRDCLVVVDYAETRTGHVVALAQAALKASNACKVRLLLLARDGGDWFDRLADGARDPAVAAILRSPSTKTGPFRMSEEPIEPEARAAVIEEALAAFAEAKQRPTKTVSIPDLSADHFGQILFIHLAALAALRGSTTTDDGELLDMALGHERAYWRHLLKGAGLGEACFDGLEQAIALLTLVGGASSARDAKALIGRTPRLQGHSLDVKTRLFDLLRRLYRRGGGLAGLQPDVLGERLVAEALAHDDELLDITLEPASTSEQARNALTVLTRLARRDPVEGQWLARALRRHIVVRAQEALEVALETGSPMPEAIAATLQAAERTSRRRVVRALRPLLPEETVNLKGLAIEIADHHALSVKAEKGDRGGWKAAKQLKEAYEDLARRHAARGDLKEAAEARERVLHYALEMDRLGKRTYSPAVAAAQLNLAAALTEICSFEGALEHAEKAEAGLRRAAIGQPDVYRSDWAGALSDLSGFLSNLGRYEEALAKAEHAEEITSDLAVRQPDEYSAKWARMLSRLGARLSNMGRYEEALAKAEQAEAVYLAADREPDAYRGARAYNLGNLGSLLNALGRYEEALAKTEQAEEIVRNLAERQPDAYRGTWAMYLRGLSTCLRHHGRYEEALANDEQVEAVLRDLAERQPDAYRAEWADAFTSLANVLRDLRRYDEALAKAKQAEVIYRDLAERQPGAYRADWALTLGNLAEVLIRCSRADEAVPVARQGVDLLVALAIHPNKHRDWLGWSMRVLAEALLETGDVTAALERAREANGIWATIFAERPAYASEQYGKTLPVLARAELASEGPTRALRTFEQGIKRIEPYFEQRPAALRGVVEGLIEALQQIDPAAARDLVPARVIETLSKLPPRA
jgi:tetratricopeptide (TPR) repeat protein/glycosyltransferase involved in cell wall biosynthesis